MTNYELVKAFNRAFGSYHQDKPGIPPEHVIELRFKLLMEEFGEVAEEAVGEGSVDLEKLGKELCDLLYVAYGMADAFGLPIDEMFREVNASNMSKLDKDGKPIYREDGKILKGPSYREPNLKQFLVEG